MNPTTEQNMQPGSSVPTHSHKLLITILILCVLVAALIVFYSSNNKNSVSSKCGTDTKCVDELPGTSDASFGRPLTKSEQDSISKAFTANANLLPKKDQEAITKAYQSKNMLSQADMDKITKANTGK